MGPLKSGFFRAGWEALSRTVTRTPKNPNIIRVSFKEGQRILAECESREELRLMEVAEKIQAQKLGKNN